MDALMLWSQTGESGSATGSANDLVKEESESESEDKDEQHKYDLEHLRSFAACLGETFIELEGLQHLTAPVSAIEIPTF